jgi:LmbE family N-acetylglucosaminyl deacetylase
MIDESHLIPFQASHLPSDQGPWLVFAPHADDESFGMGGTIARATAAGIEVDLVVLTDGALGGSQQNLRDMRKEEVAAAAKILRLRAVHFLDQPDRGLRVIDQLVERISGLLAAVRPKAVFFPGVLEYHPDHRTCALLVWEALKCSGLRDVVPISYEISVQSPANTLVDITAEVDLKKRAMSCYQSQLAQNNYSDVVLALNKLRTFTLPAECAWAEGFYKYSHAELSLSLIEWVREKFPRALEQ